MKLFEDLPSTNTPINAENLNQIKDKLVVVNATEPTGDDREKVWIQKGKNFFNKNNYIKDSSGSIGFKLEGLEAGKTYTLSSNLPLSVAKFSRHSHQNDDTVGPQKWGSFTLWTFVAGNNTNNYLNTLIYLGVSENAVSSNIEDFADYDIQIEQGSTATEYEEYIEPKIYVKNDNGVYEEFMNVKDIPYMKKISASEFFDSTSYTIDDFEAYQYGNIVNIQRMVIGNVGSSTSEVNVGVINSKYQPASNTTLRVLGSSGGNALDYICFVNSINSDGNTLKLSRITSITAASVNVYLFNTSYLIN